MIYNIDSPHWSTSINQTGVWAFASTLCIVSSLCCIPLYGDTDSVMYIVSPTTGNSKDINIMFLFLDA